jgi:hypothetical protein
VLAIAAAGQNPVSNQWQSPTGKDPLDDLITFQAEDGSFNWQPEMPLNTALMTAYAVQALLGQPYPVTALWQEQGDDEKSITGAVVGGVIGAIVVLSLGVFLLRRSRSAVRKRQA